MRCVTFTEEIILVNTFDQILLLCVMSAESGSSYLAVIYIFLYVNFKLSDSMVLSNVPPVLYTLSDEIY